MKGLQMMLQALGIKIEPEQVEKAFNDVQAAIPEMVSTIRGFDTRLKEIEARLDILLATQSDMVEDLKHAR
jgi:hypothetical protein